MIFVYYVPVILQRRASATGGAVAVPLVLLIAAAGSRNCDLCEAIANCGQENRS